MDEQKLKQILESHEKWLIDTKGGEKADLDNADLHRFNLYKVNLSRANIRRTNLCGVNLREANLNGADLRGADLNGADLRGANLDGAVLCRANLYATKLSDQIIQVGPIGSRRDYIIYTVGGDIVQCGCWNKWKGGSLAEFKKRIDEVYPADKPETLRYRREYLAAIAMFEMIRGEEKHNEANP